MRMKSRPMLLLMCSVAGFLTLSVSLLLMPVPGLAFLPGVLFWAGLILGLGAQFLLHLVLRKKLRAGKRGRWGLLRVCSNNWAKLADIGLLVSVPAAALTMTLSPAAYICYVALAAAVFFFCMHCVLNGRTFGCVMGHDRSRRKSDNSNQNEKGDGTR